MKFIKILRRLFCNHTWYVQNYDHTPNPQKWKCIKCDKKKIDLVENIFKY